MTAKFANYLDKDKVKHPTYNNFFNTIDLLR